MAKKPINYPHQGEPGDTRVKIGDVVIWHPQDALDAVKIRFPNGSPLEWDEIEGVPGKDVCGTVQVDALLQAYPYKTKGGALKGNASDPDLIVDGGLKGGVRKAASSTKAKTARKKR